MPQVFNKLLEEYSIILIDWEASPASRAGAAVRICTGGHMRVDPGCPKMGHNFQFWKRLAPHGAIPWVPRSSSPDDG
jgi:hypothetical protein